MKEGVILRILAVKIIIFIHLTMIGCQTYQLEVITTPSNASVYIFDESRKTYILAGNTPFNLDRSKKLLSFVDGNETLAISIEKKGYITERMLIEQSNAPKGSMTFTLKKFEQPELEKEKEVAETLLTQDQKVLESVLREVFRVIQLQKKSDYDVAYASVLGLISRYSETPLFWEMKGSLEMLRKNPGEALTSYKKAVALGSTSPELKDALAKLETRP